MWQQQIKSASLSVINSLLITYESTGGSIYLKFNPLSGNIKAAENITHELSG
jgi:hypothetical protein